MKLALRDATSIEDRKYAISNWLDATRFTQSCGLIQMEDFYSVMWPQYEKALNRVDMRTLIAYEATDPGFFYGFMAADPGDQRIPQHDGSVRWYPGLVLFCFVKQNYRREGIARRMFEAIGIKPTQPFLYASNTPQASRMADATFPQAKYNQLAARFPKERRV